MRKQHGDRIYAKHVLENIELLEQRLSALDSKDKFFGDMFFRFGAYYALQTLSESTQRLSQETKLHYSHIPWADIWNFRNVMVHDYLGDIDPNIVWAVIEERLPELKTAIAQIYQESL